MQIKEVVRQIAVRGKNGTWRVAKKMPHPFAIGYGMKSNIFKSFPLKTGALLCLYTAILNLHRVVCFEFLLDTFPNFFGEATGVDVEQNAK